MASIGQVGRLIAAFDCVGRVATISLNGVGALGLSLTNCGGALGLSLINCVGALGLSLINCVGALGLSLINCVGALWLLLPQLWLAGGHIVLPIDPSQPRQTEYASNSVYKLSMFYIFHVPLLFPSISPGYSICASSV